MFYLLPALLFITPAMHPSGFPFSPPYHFKYMFAKRNIKWGRSLGGQFWIQIQQVRKGLNVSSSVTILPMWIYLVKKDTEGTSISMKHVVRWWLQELLASKLLSWWLTSLATLRNSDGDHAGRSYYYSLFLPSAYLHCLNIPSNTHDQIFSPYPQVLIILNTSNQWRALLWAVEKAEVLPSFLKCRLL